MSVDYSLGFRSLEEEVTDRELPVEGDLPPWLDGALLRNGPGRFEVGGERVAHWFDGLAMPTKFDFGDGVAYTNRFLRSDTYERARAGDLASGQFGTNADGGLLSRLKRLVVPEPTDNANVNVLRIGDRYVAVTETPVGVELDPETLAAGDRFEFGDDVRAQMTTAHPRYDRERGAVVNVGTAFGRRHHYKLLRVPDEGGPGDAPPAREVVATVEVDRPSYVHSFGLTPNYAVIAEVPFDVNPLEMLAPWGEDAFVEHYDWRPEVGTRFLVIDRAAGEVVAEPRAEAFFCFHHVGAFEDGDDVVVDLVAFPDDDAVRNLYLDQLDGSIPSLDGHLRRYRLPLDGSDPERTTLYDRGMTLPRKREDRDGRRYRYAYGQGTPSPDGERPQRLVKVDVESGDAREYTEEGVFFGEPVFVPDPGGDAEDDGVVLSVAMDGDAERSVLVVLDAATFERRARAPLPHVVPFDFHGRYFADL